MSGSLTRGIMLSKGETRLMLACVFTALFSAAIAFIIVVRLDPNAVFNRPLTTYEYWIVVSGFLGGASATFFNRHALGQTDYLMVLRGLASTTFLSALIAGTLALPLYGTMFGPFTLVVVFFAAPMTALLWFFNLVAVHILVREWQSERDSIFGDQRPEPLWRQARRTIARLSLGR